MLEKQVVRNHGNTLKKSGERIPEAYRNGVLMHIIPEDGFCHRDIIGWPQDQAVAVLSDRDAAVHGGGAYDAEIQILSAKDEAVYSQGLKRQVIHVGGINHLSPVIEA